MRDTQAIVPDGGPLAEQPLFRTEVMAARQAQWMGTVLLEPRTSHRIVTYAALAAAAAILALVFFGSYTRTARIEGWLLPERGLIRLHVPYPGIVARIHVREGESVKKGAPLLSLSAEVRSEALGATAEEVVKRLTARRDSLLVERAAQNALHDQRERDLAQRVEALRTQQKHLDSQIALQRDRLQISRRTVQRERTMRAGDLIPVARLERTEQDHLDQTARLEALERDRSTLQNDLIQVKGALQELPMLRQNALAELDRNADAVGQELAEAEARRSAVIVAPEDGIVTGILTEPGGNVTPSAPLMNLVPAGSKLQAQLFGPSGAIGFVKPGQRVSLRYESYSYQKFGAYGGTVASVSRSPVAAGDLPNQLASASPGSEPLFRVIVDLDRQTANAYGEAVPLQAGMRLDANVAIEARQLYEWILDPLYTMTGRMSR